MYKCRDGHSLVWSKDTGHRLQLLLHPHRIPAAWSESVPTIPEKKDSCIVFKMRRDTKIYVQSMWECNENQSSRYRWYIAVYCVHDVCRDARINLIKRIKNQCNQCEKESRINRADALCIVHRICTDVGIIATPICWFDQKNICYASAQLTMNNLEISCKRF